MTDDDTFEIKCMLAVGEPVPLEALERYMPSDLPEAQKELLRAKARGRV